MTFLVVLPRGGIADLKVYISLSIARLLLALSVYTLPAVYEGSHLSR